MADKHILVIDMDGTTIGVDANLTQEIVEFAMQLDDNLNNLFAGFYACTARSTGGFLGNIAQYTRPSIYNNPKNSNPLTVTLDDKSVDVDRHYFLGKFLHRAVRCFHVVTELPLFEVSTADDVYYENCGEAYKQLILPHEEQLIKSIDSDSATLNLSAPDSHPAPFDKQNCKNTQLQQITRHAQSLFPGDTIRLTFIDDLYHNCVSGLTALDGVEGASIRVLYFDHSIRLVRNIYDVMSERETEEKTFVGAGGLFDGNQASATTSANDEAPSPRLMIIQ